MGDDAVVDRWPGDQEERQIREDAVQLQKSIAPIIVRVRYQVPALLDRIRALEADRDDWMQRHDEICRQVAFFQDAVRDLLACAGEEMANDVAGDPLVRVVRHEAVERLRHLLGEADGR